jgi:mannosyltransferase
MRKRLCAVPPRIWLMLITLLAMGLRFFRLGYQSLWFDEAFSWAVSLVSLKLSLQALLADGGNLPFYYLLLRAWLNLGQSEIMLRFPSAAFGILSVPLIYQVAHLTFDQRIALLSASFLALSPFHVWYSQEARMYSLVMFSALGSAYFFLRVLRGGNWKSWMGLTVFTALGYPTGFSNYLVSPMELFFLICTFRTTYSLLWSWTLSQGLAILPTAPWLIALVTRSVKSFGFGWIPQPGLVEPLKTLWNFSLGHTNALTPLVALSLVPFAMAFLLSLRPNQPTNPMSKRFLFVWLAFPIVFTFLVSLRLPIYIDRFLIVSLPPYLILVAYGITRIRKDILRYGLTIAVLAVLAFNTTLIYFDPIFAKEDWRGAIAYIESRAQESDLIVSRYIQDDLLINYYYHGPIERAVMGTGPATVPPQVLAQGHLRMWLIYRPPQESPRVITRHEPFRLEDERDPSVRAWLAANQGNLLTDRNFPGVYVVLYRILLESEP